MKILAYLALAALAAISLSAPWIAPHDPAHQYREEAGAAPGAKFPLGSDDLGRDILSRLLHSGRWSLLCGVLATAISLICGIVMGLCAAGGPSGADRTILWLADLSMSFPWLYLLFTIRGLLPLSLEPEIALTAVIALVGLAGWAAPARLVRSAAKSILAMDYVAASRAFGASRFHILFRHVMPALGPVISPRIFVLLPRYVLAESSLSFLGLGLGEPTPTWGAMLASARHSMGAHPQWWLLSPAIPIAVLALASARLAESGERQ